MAKLFDLDAYRSTLTALKSYLDNYIATSSHNHTNQEILNKITEAFTTEQKQQIDDNKTTINQIKDGEISVGKAGTADKLTTSKNFSISGGVTASAVGFNGTNNVELQVTSLNAIKLNVANGDTLILDGDCL